MNWGPFHEKKSLNAEKKGDPWEFSAIPAQNFETIEGGPFGKKPKTPRNAEKK